MHGHYVRCERPCGPCRAREIRDGWGALGRSWRREMVECFARGASELVPVSRAAIGWWLRACVRPREVLAEAEELAQTLAADRWGRVPVPPSGGWELSVSPGWDLTDVVHGPGGAVTLTINPMETR